MEIHMKQILVDLDDRTARDLERVAPTKTRSRAQFVRLAIRRAIDLALDRETDAAYRVQPLPAVGDDLEGWDPHNELARPAVARRRKRVA
jgi:hypothetical protein